jgi:uncharacterized protein YcbK (DUF882 family)
LVTLKSVFSWPITLTWRTGVRPITFARALATGLALATVAPKALESAAANGDTRTIFLYHSHSKESIAATFRVNGHYDAETLDKLNWFLRDWRNDEPTKMDPRLFDVLWEAYRSNERMGPDDPIVVVSAYRCPATNAMLRRRSRAVAEHSQHMLGKAMDTTMPGLSMEKLREVGMRMQRGGVGYYPTAGTPFVHLDVGGVRHWPRMNYDQLVRLFPDGKTVHIPSNGKPLAGYEEARADILARGGEAVSIAEATSSGGGLGGFFARLFGVGGGEDAEEEIRQSGPVAKPTRIAGRNAQAAQPADSDEGGEVAQLEPQRRLMAKAETNLPQGTIYMGAPPTPAPTPAPAAARPEPQPQPALQPEASGPQAKPAPIEPDSAEAAAEPEKPHPLDDAPPPPRRPDSLMSEVVDAPQPPPRPVDLAGLPSVITRGRVADKVALRSTANVDAPLAFATASIAPREETVPLPVPRPVIPLRAAAAAKAEESRVARAAATQMAPARVDRAALAGTLSTKAPARTLGKGAGAAPALRAAAKADLFAAAPAAGHAAHFGAKPGSLDGNGFSKQAN